MQPSFSFKKVFYASILYNFQSRSQKTFRYSHMLEDTCVDKAQFILPANANAKQISVSQQPEPPLSLCDAEKFAFHEAFVGSINRALLFCCLGTLWLRGGVWGRGFYTGLNTDNNYNNLFIYYAQVSLKKITDAHYNNIQILTII